MSETQTQEPAELEVDAVTAPETKVVSPEEGIEDLRRKLEAEKAGRLDAERRAKEADARARQATTEVEDANLTLVKNAIASAKQQMDAQKAALKKAMADGDHDAAVDIQEAMADLAAKRLQLENGKAQMEAAPKKPPPAPDPVEALASQLTPRSAAWVRANPQFASDQRLYRKMIAAHNLAEADGITPDTDDYFAAIEGTLGIRRAAVVQDDPTAEAAQVTQRRVSPAASAPVSRTPPGAARSNTIRLTAQEREMASMMGMTEEDYGKNKMALKAEGRLN
jgi:hypothetical protein